MAELSLVEASVGVGELEWPEEVGGLLEVWSDGVDLVDQIFNGDDTVLAEVLLNESVVGQWDSLLVDLTVSALVDKLTDGLEVGLTVSDPWLNDPQHLRGGLVDTNKDTVVDLEKTEKLQDLAWLRSDLVDTLDTNDEDELGLILDEEVTLLLGVAGEGDLLTLSIAVLLNVGLSALEDNLTGLLCSGLLLSEGSGLSLLLLILSLSLLQESLWNENLLSGWDGRWGHCIVFV